MNRLLLLISSFLFAGVTIISNEIIQSDPGLPAVGILGSMGISGIYFQAFKLNEIYFMREISNECPNFVDIVSQYTKI